MGLFLFSTDIKSSLLHALNLFVKTYIILIDTTQKLERSMHMDYISTAQAADKWGISERRVQKLCEEGRIDGVIRFSRVWAIPKDAPKPIDPRKKPMNRSEEG